MQNDFKSTLFEINLQARSCTVEDKRQRDTRIARKKETERQT